MILSIVFGQHGTHTVADYENGVNSDLTQITAADMVEHKQVLKRLRCPRSPNYVMRQATKER